MIYLKLIYILIVALPDIIRLVKAVNKDLEDEAANDKVKKDLAAIKEAFKKRDAAELRRIFNS